jgi:hypothetical protein
LDDFRFNLRLGGRVSQGCFCAAIYPFNLLNPRLTPILMAGVRIHVTAKLHFACGLIPDVALVASVMQIDGLFVGEDHLFQAVNVSPAYQAARLVQQHSV